jgi:hypothetical protein
MFVAPNGKVFYAGENNPSRYLDFTGTGSWTTVGNRMVANRSYGSAVMYEPGKILYAGGGVSGPTNTAEVIDLNQSTPAWRFTGSMAFARHQTNATILPDGTVLVTGGTSGPGKANTGAAVHAAELWNPATEQWTTLASNQIVRVYHSTSILLPDARVLHSGSGDGGGTPQELNAEIFSPPYLFNADGSSATHPTIASAPATIGYGESFSVQTPDAASIAKVTLIRLGAATHAFDQNQRFNNLNFSGDANGLTVTSPANPNLAPPGHYMLFVLNRLGVPSVAKIVHLQ